MAALVIGLVGVLKPAFRFTEFSVRPDHLSHAALIYAVTLLAALSFPRVKPVWMALLFGVLAVAVELAQLWGLITGSGHLRDLIADFAGILLALVPIAVVRARRFARQAGA